mmetsp:Transcript_55295/g.103917  ORF Transcript_55295/g.103917 Transcript_55295/m.103917 type:complete len:303 (+) Transcript_55295:2421-3329(+)
MLVPQHRVLPLQLALGILRLPLLQGGGQAPAFGLHIQKIHMIQREQDCQLLKPLSEICRHLKNLFFSKLPQNHRPIVLLWVLQHVHSMGYAMQGKLCSFQLLLEVWAPVVDLCLASATSATLLLRSCSLSAPVYVFSQMPQDVHLPLGLLIAQDRVWVKDHVMLPFAAQAQLGKSDVLERKPRLGPRARLLVHLQAQQTYHQPQNLGCRRNSSLSAESCHEIDYFQNLILFGQFCLGLHLPAHARASALSLRHLRLDFRCTRERIAPQLDQLARLAEVTDHVILVNPGEPSHPRSSSPIKSV